MPKVMWEAVSPCGNFVGGGIGYRHLAISRWGPEAGAILPSKEGSGGLLIGLGASGLLVGGRGFAGRGDRRRWWKVRRGMGGFHGRVGFFFYFFFIFML